MKYKNLINLGKISKPHGLNGYFYFKLHHSLEIGATLLVGTDGGTLKEAELLQTKQQGKRTLIKLSIAEDRTALEPYLGLFLWADEASKVEEPKNELDQYKNLEVLDSEGSPLGICLDFYDCGAGPVIVLENDKNLRLEMPFNDAYFTKSATLTANFPKAFFDEFWQKI